MTADPKPLRLFIAVDVPRSHLEKVDALIAPLRASMPEARFIPLDNQHVTLQFLGRTMPEQRAAIERAIGEVAAHHAPVEVALTGLGAFPNARRARVVWIGVADPDGSLAGVASDLATELDPLGFAPEDRPFTPHLTLARLKTPRRLPDGTLDLGLAALAWHVDSVALYRSHLHPKGARYERLVEFPLRSDNR